MFPIYLRTFNRVKLKPEFIFIKCFASVVFLTPLPKSSIQNKIVSRASNLLNILNLQGK